MALVDDAIANLFKKLKVTVNRAVGTVKRLTAASGPPDQQAQRAPPPPEKMSLNTYALIQAYILMSVTGLGYLALTWSTVVLLGGFVSSLGKKDFWCLTAISMVQAARVFNDFGDNLYATLMILARQLFKKVVANPARGLSPRLLESSTFQGVLTALWVQVVLLIVQLLSIPVLAAVYVALFVYFYGPVSCIVLSAWRIMWLHHYGSTAAGVDESKEANLVPALYTFYIMVVCQGLLFFSWWLIDWAATWVVISFLEKCQLPKQWGSTAVVDYLYDIRAKCWQDPSSVDGMNLMSYAVDLVDSESQKDYLSGARMLDTFIKQGADVRSLVLPSRPKVQKLIDTLGWRSSSRELREVVARIVAYLAGDIHLSQFPGAIQCISSLLLDTTTLQPYWNNQQGPNDRSTQISRSNEDFFRKGAFYYLRGSNEDIDPKGRLISAIKGVEEYGAENQEQDEVADISTHGSKGDDGWNELILQGMAILERLAFDQHNCSDIFSTPDIIPKIMAPLYSSTLTQDINVSAWANVANGSLKVVHRLIRAPGWVGKKLGHQISSSKQALSNLESLLQHGNKQLQMRAVEILTELALDSSTDLKTETKENLLRKQLQITLTDDGGDEEKFRVTAGKTLALLSRTESVSVFIMTEQSNIVDHLTQVLNATNNITYKTVALEVLENLCTHSVLDKNYVKESLLPKILGEVLSCKRELPRMETRKSELEMACAVLKNTMKRLLPTRNIAENNQAISGPSDDEENQVAVPEHGSQIMSSEHASEEQNAKMEFQEALLSLTLVICDKLINADDFDDVARKISLREGEFVGKLKLIVEENCEATADCLRIVKLCGQIAILMMQRSQYNAHFKDQEFVESLSKASKIMSNLESCMLFAGTDGGRKKTVKPLLSDLAEKAHTLLGLNE